MIDPPKLDLKGITLQSLRAPLDEWRLLLPCAALPAALYMVMAIGGAELFPTMATYTLPTTDVALFWYLLPIAPMLVIQWRWLSALWHGDGRQGIGFSLSPIGWRYIVLFTVAQCLYQAFLLMPHFAFWALISTLVEVGTSDTVEAIIVLGLQLIAWAFYGVAIWITARLMPWTAVIVDRLQIVGPAPVWWLTRGQGWRISIVVFLFSLLVGAVNWLIGLFSSATSFMGDFYLVLFLYLLVTIYTYAAFGAASLLIYRHLTQQETDLSIDVF
jgi:hypothetical protein